MTAVSIGIQALVKAFSLLKGPGAVTASTDQIGAASEVLKRGMGDASKPESGDAQTPKRFASAVAD